MFPVCLSGRVTQKLSLRLTWFFYTRHLMPMARSSCKMIQIWTQEFFSILHHWEIGQNMPSKYATTSNVCYNENMHPHTGWQHWRWGKTNTVRCAVLCRDIPAASNPRYGDLDRGHDHSARLGRGRCLHQLQRHLAGNAEGRSISWLYVTHHSCVT